MLLRSTVAPRERPRWSRLSASLRARRIHLVVIGGLVTLALLQRPGSTTFDTKLDLTENPLGFLERAFSLWNPQTNFGELQNQAYGYLFPVGPFFAVGRSLGLASWVVQWLWVSLLLVVAYAGVVALCKALPVGTRWSRVLAGLAYALCPRMVTTLGPISAEAMIVALLPWTVLPLLRWREWGVRRAAALSALAVAGMGGVNATATLAVLPLAGLVALSRPPGARVRLTAWWALCVTLACLWWVGPLLLLGRYSPPFLDYIESAVNTAGGVGLSESLRGTTHWVAGVITGGQPWWPSGHELVSSPWLMITTIVVGVVGLVSLLDRRVPARTALLGSAVLGLVVMSLGWDGPPSGSPIGESWRALLDGPLAPLRNVHKFDPLVRLPVAVGVAHGIGLLLTARHHGHAVAIARGAAVAGLAACCLSPLAPALNPGMRPGPGWDEQPGWWREAAEYVADRDPNARTLVLPSSGFGTQIWGRTVDEPLQPLAQSPWVSRSKVFLGSEGAGRMLEAVDGWLESGRGSPALGDVLARAGIRFVIVRGDLDRRLSGTPPIAVVRQALARSGGISNVAQFGPELAQGGVSGLRVSGFGVDTATPAIDVYEVEGPVPVARLAAMNDVTGITGGPESVPRLLEDGLLDTADPAVLAMDDPPADSRWLITDGHARRERNFGRQRENLGPVLTGDEPFRQTRAVPDLLSREAAGHQAVARYTDIEHVSASTSLGYPDSLRPTDTALGPWSALDGDPFTAWRSDGGGAPVGEWLRVDFHEPRWLERLDVQFADSRLIGPRIAAIDVRTEAGVLRRAVRADGSVDAVTLPGGWTDFVKLEVAEIEGNQDGEVGIIGLELPDVDPGRVVVAPADQPESTRQVRPPSGLSFHRLDPTRGACVIVEFSTRCDPNLAVRGDEPTSVVRGFTTHATANYRVEGTVLPRPGQAVQRLLEPLGGIRIESSSSLGGDPAVAGARAVDGNPATSWVADSFDGLPTLRLDWSEERAVSAFQVVTADQPVAARPTAVQVEVEGVRHDLPVVEGWVRFPPVRTDQLAVTMTDWETTRSVDPRSGVSTTVPPGIAELNIPGLDDLVVFPDLDASTGRRCGSGPTLLIDGSAVPTQVEGTIRDVFENRPLSLSACGAAASGVDISSGQHTIEVRADEMFAADTVVLQRSTEVRPGSGPRPGTVEVLEWKSTNRTLEITTSEPALLVVPENSNSGWVARSDGARLPPVRVDGWQQAWQLPADFDGKVELLFAPQAAFEAALGLGAIGLTGLLGLAGAPTIGRRFELVSRVTTPRSWARARRTLALSGTVVLGGLLAGVAGAVVFGVAGVLGLGRRHAVRAVGATAGLAVLGVSASVAFETSTAAAMRTWACLPVVAIVCSAAMRALVGDRQDETMTPMAARMVTKWARLRIWVKLAFALAALQIGWRAWSLSHGSFWMDDFVYIDRASHGLSLDYLFQNYQGHVMPGQFLLTWVSTELAPLAWLPAAGLVVALQLVASLLLMRLVRALAGDGPLGFIAFAVYALSPLTFTASMWWASALQSLPLQISMVWALTAHLRYLRTGSRRAFGMAVLALLVGLLFWQKAVLIPFVLVAFTVLVGPLFTGRSVRKLLRRSHAALAAYVAIGVGYGVAFLLLTEPDDSGVPSPTELGQLLRYMILDTFVPGLLGVMGGAEPAAPLLAPTPSPLVSLVTWEALGLAVLASVVLARWTAVRGWLLLLGYLLVDFALVATARLDFVGPLIGRDPRYTADAVLVAVVALAAVGSAVRARHGSLPWPLWQSRAVMSGALVLFIANASLISTYGVVERLPMDDARTFVANAREAAGRPGGVDLVDGPVPDSVVGAIFADRARASVVVSALPEPPRFGEPTADLRMLDGFGLAQPIDVTPRASARSDETSSCAWSIRRAPVAIALDSDVPAGRWVVRVGYFSGAPTSGRLLVGERSRAVEFLGGVHHLYLEFTTEEAMGSISVGDLPPGDAICVTDVVVGTAWPRQDS